MTMAQESVPAYTPTNWWERHVSKEANRDQLKMSERIGNVIGMAFIVVVALFFLNAQLQGSAFFTASFGLVEQVLFYGSMLYGVVPSAVRALTGQRNLGRFFDLFGSLFAIVALSYFLTVNFPFDFTALIGYLPAGVQPDFSWFNNDLFRLLFVFALFITAITLVYNAILYIFVRRELKARKAGMGRM